MQNEKQLLYITHAACYMQPIIAAGLLQKVGIILVNIEIPIISLVLLIYLISKIRIKHSFVCFNWPLVILCETSSNELLIKLFFATSHFICMSLGSLIDFCPIVSHCRCQKHTYTSYKFDLWIFYVLSHFAEQNI